MRERMLLILGFALVLGGFEQAKPRTEAPPRAMERIQKEVRHELLMLPYLGVFDNLAYKVNGSAVTLIGQVTRPP